MKEYVSHPFVFRWGRWHVSVPLALPYLSWSAADAPLGSVSLARAMVRLQLWQSSQDIQALVVFVVSYKQEDDERGPFSVALLHKAWQPLLL